MLSPMTPMIRISPATLAMGCLALLAAAAMDTVAAGSAGRDAVWRSIFQREAVPPGSEPAQERIRLGHDLFRDPRLSGGEDLACASCHDPDRAFTDGRTRGRARDGSDLKRNVPHLYNLAWGSRFFWDGRAPTLEAQVRGPLLARDEMAGDFGQASQRLTADPAMASRFAAAFPSSPIISEETIVAALAAYERSLVSPLTRFDRWVAGDEAALSPGELQGFRLFTGKAGCVACHGGWRFTDDGFHDIGLKGSDPGRGAVEGGVPGLAEFKTPGLRELAHTAPYMHDGSKRTLAEVLDHYAGGLEKRPSLAQNIVRDLVLGETERAALIAFLLTLSSESEGVPKAEADRAVSAPAP